MAIENIYYLDQFSGWIYLTNSDQAYSIPIENVSSLGGSENIVNLQLSDTDMFLFGDSALVLKRPVTGGAWVTILDDAGQSALLPLDEGMGEVISRLNNQNTKTRSTITTKDGNVYIAFLVQDNTNSFKTKLIQYHGSSWSSWADIKNESFMGWADLNYSINLVGLKTALTRDQYYLETGNEQVYENCNVLRMILGSSMTVLDAPTDALRYAITHTQSTIVPPAIGGGEGGGVTTIDIRPNGEIIATTTQQLIRISADFSSVNHYDLAPDPGYPGYINSSLLLNDHLFCYASNGADKKFVVYDLTNNTISLNGSFFGLSGWSVEIFAVDLGDGTALIVPYNFGNYTMIFNPATYAGSLPYTGDQVVSAGWPWGYAIPNVALPNGDVLRGNISNESFTHPWDLQKYNKSAGTWSAITGILPNDVRVQAMKVITNGTYAGKVIIFYQGITTGFSWTGVCHYVIYDPATDSIILSALPVDPSVAPSGYDVFTHNVWALEYPYMMNTTTKVVLDTGVITNKPLVSQPQLGTLYSKIIDANTVEGLSIYSVPIGFSFDKFNFSFTVQEPVKSLANMQAVTAISTSEVYCVTASGNAGNMEYNPVSFIYKWDGTSWSTLHTFDGPTWYAVTGWGEGYQTTQMSYTPLLMSSRYIGSDLELVMLREEVTSVYTFTAGVLNTDAMNATNGGNTFGGATAPSIPFLYNVNLCADVSLSTDTGTVNFTVRNEIQLYAEARLIFKDSLGVYCLIRNSEVYFSTKFPVTSDSTGFTIMVPAEQATVMSVPFVTDSLVAMHGQITNIDSYMDFWYDVSHLNANGGYFKFLVPFHGSVSSNHNPMSFTLTAAPGYAFTGTSAATGVFTFKVPATPSPKFLPNVNGGIYTHLNLIGSYVYAAGQEGTVRSSDGATWIPGPFIPPIITTSPTSGYFAQINGVCENSPSSPIAISDFGLHNLDGFSYWAPIVTPPPPAPPPPEAPLPPPFDVATPLAFVGNEANVFGSIDDTSPFYPNYAVYCNVFSFRLEAPQTVTITMGTTGGFYGYLVVSSLDGTPGSYTENFWIDNDTGGYTQDFPAGTYFIIPQGFYDTSFGDYTLDVQLLAITAPVPPKIRRMTYDSFGGFYLAIFSQDGNDYVNTIGWSTTGNPGDWAISSWSGSLYWDECALRTDGSGTTMAFISGGDGGILKIDTTSAGDPVVTRSSGFIGTGGTSTMTTDGAGNWLQVSGAVLYSSTDNGSSWTQLGLTPFNAKLCEHVNGKFVVIVQNGSTYSVDSWSKSDINFSTGVTKNVGVLPTDIANSLYDIKTLGNDLVLLSGDRVWVSSDTGVSWGIPRILSFTSSANNITVGDSVNLTWSTVGATTAAINNGVGTIATSGTTAVSPSVNTTYTLTATGDTIVTATKAINVYAAPTITSFTQTAGSPGTTLNWTVSGSSASINNGVGTVGTGTSSTTVNPASTSTYTISVTNLASRVVTSSLLLHPSRSWDTIAYSGSLFMAVGQSGDVVTSSNGTSWTAATTIPSFSIGYASLLKYVNGKWIAPVCTGGDHSTNTLHVSSDNGATWQVPTTLPAGSYTSSAYGASTYVAVAWGADSYYGARVIYSSDADTWTAATIGLPTSISFQDVIYANSMFVAVASSSGTGQTIFTSADGITWVTANYPFGGVGDQGQWRSIAYGAGTFVVVGTGGRYIATSSNGTDWTVTDIGASSNQSRKVIYDGTQFVRLNLLYSGSYTGFHLESSANGTSWSTLYNLSASYGSPTDFDFNGTKYVILGSGIGNLLTQP